MAKRSTSPKKVSRAARVSAYGRSPIDLNDLNRIVKLERRRGISVGAKGCEAIRQNAIFARIQKFWNGLSKAQKAAKLRELIALRELKGQAQINAFVQMGVRDKTLVGAADEKHAQDDWFGRYFTGPVARIFIEGMIVAGQRSFVSGQPVGIYWVAGAGREVKASVAQSERQVTFLLMTPPQPRAKTAVRQLSRPEPLWVVSGRGRGTTVEQVFPTALA